MSAARDIIRDLALGAGFDAVGFTDADIGAEVAEGLRAYLAAGHHGDMGWLETRSEQRASPRALWPEAKSAIVLGLSYAPSEDPMLNLRAASNATISVYAQGDDYHEIIKKRLKSVARAMIESLGGDVKVFVDTAPLMEKPLAERAGIGWQGKHTNLVHREHGSWLFLGVILTTLELGQGDGHDDLCGTCTRCLDVCPTNAFLGPHKLDARRCISYLTIEHKGPIPRELRPLMGNRIYGCDDCLAICPWNKFAATARESAFHPRAELKSPRLAELATLDDVAFRKLFSKSPIKRIGRDRFIRNVLIAIGNSGDDSLTEHAERLARDPSPLVRGAAVWALGRLIDGKAFAARATVHAPNESDPAVQEEWQNAPSS